MDLCLIEPQKMWRTAVLILFCIGAAHCSALFLISVITYPTCLDIPNGQSEVVLLPDGSQAEKTSTANTLCGTLGSENIGQPVTAIRLRIDQGVNPFTDILQLTLSSVPNVGETINYNDNIPDDSLDCKDTTSGSDCSILQEKLLLTFKSTKLYAKYPMVLGPTKYFYGVNIAYLRDYGQCCNEKFIDKAKDCCFNKEFYPGSWKTTTNDVFVASDRCNDYGDTTSKKSENWAVLNTLTSTQGVDGFGSCPTLEQIIGSVKNIETNKEAGFTFQQLYIEPDKGVLDCGSFFCKIPGKDIKTDTWNAQNEYYLGPRCRLGTLEANPVGEQRIRLSFIDGTSGAFIDSIDLYSGDGDFLRGTRRGVFPSSAKILNIDTPTNVIGYARIAQILLCGQDSSNNPNLGTAASSNYMDDMPPRSSGIDSDPSDILYNPWLDVNRNAAGQSSNLLTKCVVPLPACRKLFKDGSVGYNITTTFGYWAYISESNRRFWNNAGCNQNVDRAAILNTQGLIARKCYAMATSTSGTEPGLSGECIPSFEQNNDATAYTPCQIFGELAKYAAGVVSSGNRDTPSFRVSSSPPLTFMSPTFNPLVPSEWVVPNGYMTEALGGGTATTEVLVYLPASQVGVVVPVPSGMFLDTGMLCGATQAGPGAITYSAKSRGRLGGNVYVAFTWTVSNTESQAIISPTSTNAQSFNNKTNVYVQTVSLPVNGVTVYETFNFGYGGSLWLSLKFTLQMYSIVPNTNGKTLSLSDTRTVTCTITEGTVQETVKSVIDNYVVSPEISNFCRWYNPRTIHCWSIFEHGTWGLFYNLFLLWPTVGITLITIILFFICTCKKTSKLDKQTKPKEVDKED